ncbi:hypothetical protein [Halarchaeum sp. P4]|uniref:hypothetical protein n=1 Tax=Halarchaeum sp. P4 TaxID=3421639 RepID=UPI003EC04A7F
MAEKPTGRSVRCPTCDTLATVLVPAGSSVSRRDDDADGKVRATCRDCGEEFPVYYHVER